MEDVQAQFDAMISREFMNGAEDPAELETDVYGLRVMFYHRENPERHRTVLMPWLSYNQERADAMRHLMATSQPQLMLMSLARVVDDPAELLQWVPLGVRVVRLAEIPF